MKQAITAKELIDKLNTFDPKRVVRTYDGELDEWRELIDAQPLGELAVELIFQ